MAKAKPKCWCGKTCATERALSIHKTRQAHWQTPEEKRAARERQEAWEAENRTTKVGYIEEVSENLANGRQLELGDKVRIERVGVIKEIVTTGNNQTVAVRIDIISRTYKKI